MRITEPAEARIADAGNLLVAAGGVEFAEPAGDFFGTAVAYERILSGAAEVAGKSVYLCGDLAGVDVARLRDAARVFAVRELSHGHREGAPWTVVGLGRVPVRTHGMGVYYRRFFEPGEDHFGRITAEHEFQSLTESTKPATAHRSGIYLTPVTREGDALRFRLLRCSTNLSGPTDNFRPTDTSVVGALNREAATVFAGHAPLNHVLAQIYRNTSATAERKQSKAKISDHADKTKDMPADGIMAFCTFYDGLDGLRPSADDPFDFGVNGVSGLTRLHFRRKDADGEGPESFTVPLYPGSVFFMPLSTNRLYTHAIRPSALDAGLLPTRLGYVVRCSATEAVHDGGRTFIVRDARRVELGPPTPEGMGELRRLYAEENRSSAFIDYGESFGFSMNTGDYRAPRI
ncbi:hypothetical protein [Phytomonospora endophytica]|uniref:Uncharacterized protein n=1 Tax=Phytomonospora endophytica TaxID=714109 RepID=A0A841FIH7_9ACTN|nr:hypothetical protein [Phytomonospora endophytica]MBB6033372.1 hypothetical protein [Phytomonospora endophytica]GIG70857.1 hypothetical protein Pen01_71520 [Phytomonospora endophytica]